MTSIRTMKDPRTARSCSSSSDFDGLAALVQIGVVEVHIWGCTIDEIEKPDQIVFDLDPDEGARRRGRARGGAGRPRASSTISACRTFVKTSGGKGFHVVVPLKPKADWDDGQGLRARLRPGDGAGGARPLHRDAVEEGAHGQHLHRLSAQRPRLDHGRAYSSRAKKGATVSMPVTWEMVADGVRPADFAIGDEALEKRLRAADPWADFFDNGKSLDRG